MPTAGDTDRFLVLNNANGNPAIQSTVAPIGDAVARTDNDGNNYNGLTMTVTLMGQTVAFGDAAVLSGGSGMVTVGGGNVSVGGTIVGTITNFGFASPVADDGSGSFMITFNANATEAAVLAIVNDLSYVTSATENDLVTARTAGDVMTVTVVVSDGGLNTVTETITITLP